jgi:glycosyltransferase involved in cell wall biosynthesis
LSAKQVALVHYTAAPVIGGVENFIEAQRNALRELGCSVRLAVGEGGRPCDMEVARLPLITPADARIGTSRAVENSSLPQEDDPLVKEISCSLRNFIAGCGVCIVHNAFTVYLNPYLTIAVHALAREMTNVHWIAWCYDLSADTAFWPPLDPMDRSRVLAVPGVSYVAPSAFRAKQLERLLDLAPGKVTVIPPAVSYRTWLGISERTAEVVSRFGLEDAEPLVLVPAKLLPHKNLDLALRAASELQVLCPDSMVVLTGAMSAHQLELSAEVRRSLGELAESLGAGRSVRFLSDEGTFGDSATIRDLMLLSDVVLLTSTEEGYGLPIREAAALRTPVLCSDIPAFREAAGDGATLFDAAIEPHELALIISRIAETPANRQRRRTIRSWAEHRQSMKHLLVRARPARGV